MIFTYTSLTRMNELVEKANKQIKKLKLDAITVASTEARKVSRGKNAFGEELFDVVYDVDLVIPTELVKIEGQEVVARLENIENMNMITRIGKNEVNLDEYRDAAILCQHCGYKRNRKGSWVVQSAEKGLIQIGDNCVDLYFGVDVEKILNTSYAIFVMLDSDRDGRGERYYDFSRFTALVVWMTMTEGFVTQKHADESATGSTRSEAHYMVERPRLIGEGAAKEIAKWDAENEKFMTWKNENFKDMNIFENILDWWMSKEEVTEFEHNCRLAIMSQNPKFLGLAAYATKMWVDANFAPAKAEKLKSGAVSQWVGEVKKREDFNLKVVGLYSFETDFGTTTLVSFEDENGNQLIWKASSNPGMTLGQSYKVKGTVKAHGEYKGQKQTTISRCAVV